ncbi:MAG TPA: HAD-IA family hydrolase [Xanthobacteraceae bacterium]|jgi:putative hydrolase of the HAD superfamily
MNAPVKNAGGDGCRHYTALLLDFGSVIQKSFFETRGPLERLLNVPSGSLKWAGPFDPAGDTLWQQVLNGEISERDYWGRHAQEVGSMVGQDWAIREFCLKHNELSTKVTLRPEVLALISDVKNAGLKFGILTNELELFHGENWLDTMPFAAQIDAIVDATNTKILKPDPRAYALALDALSLPADEVVFIDDQQRNVDGGEAVGITSLHLDITQHQKCIAQARALLKV